ncbi:MAG: hypothetical protein R3D32_08600 [Nitratireductor sp.]
MRKSRILINAAALLVGAVILAGCNSAGGNKVENTLTPIDPQIAQEGQGTLPPADAIQDLRAYCPKTVLRAGTETYDIYPAKTRKGDPELEKKLRFRATISDVVRECNSAGAMLNIKVGVAGRLISGPASETGSFTMPLRIVVTQGDAVLYSQLHDVPGEIPPGRTNNLFSFVDGNISIPKPDKENIIIYAGFDELKKDTPGAVPPAAKELEPVN